jgi:8-oxo-dGTP diphosphatase
MTDLPQVAVGAVAVRDNSLLMVKRAQEPARGLWSIPGGRLQRGEYLADAVRREVKEETGLDVDVGDLLGLFEVVGDPHYVILDYLASPLDGSEPSTGDDVSEVRWVPLNEIANLECTPRLVETLKGWGLDL